MLRVTDVARILILLGLLTSWPALAEDDGEEFLEWMNRASMRGTARAHIDDVILHLDGDVFCLVKGSPDVPAKPSESAFAAVKSFLESHPAERHRPRRYLITQALRTAYPCPAR